MQRSYGLIKTTRDENAFILMQQRHPVFSTQKKSHSHHVRTFELSIFISTSGPTT